MSDEAGGLEVRFRLTEADFRAFQRERRDPARGHDGLRLAFLTVAAIGVMALTIRAWLRGLHPRWLGLCAIGVFAVFVPISLLWQRRAEAQQVRKLGLFDDDATVALGEEGIRHSDGSGEALTRWAFVAIVAETASAIHVTLKNNSVIIVPRSAFRDAADQQGFLAFARAHVR